MKEIYDPIPNPYTPKYWSKWDGAHYVLMVGTECIAMTQDQTLSDAFPELMNLKKIYERIEEQEDMISNLEIDLDRRDEEIAGLEREIEILNENISTLEWNADEREEYWQDKEREMENDFGDRIAEYEEELAEVKAKLEELEQ